MDCPICLQHIELHNEAYLNPCFHRFCFTCIQQWTDSQKRHPLAASDSQDSIDGSTLLACPMCKRPYTHIVYDCIGRSYRLLATSGQPGRDNDVALTAQQRRRRALYMTPQQHQPEDTDGQTQAVATGRRVQPRPPNSPQTSEWVTRELQALLLAEDVDVISQHLVGVLQGMANRQKQSRCKGPGTSPVYGRQPAFLASIAQAVQGFLDAHAAAFAGQLWSFLESGLSISAHDALLFGAEGAAAASSDDEQAQGPEAEVAAVEAGT